MIKLIRVDAEGRGGARGGEGGEGRIARVETDEYLPFYPATGRHSEARASRVRYTLEKLTTWVESCAAEHRGSNPSLD